MKLLMYGVNNETVMKEDADKYRLNYDNQKLQMIDIHSFDGVEEIVVLVNDFRSEYYLYVDEEVFSHGDFLRYLAKKTDKNLQDIILETYSKFNEDVLRHLYEVSSGYLSKPLGSFDILESVENALMVAHEVGTIEKVLTKLFNGAISLAYSLKINDEVQPLNESCISKYVSCLKKKMSSLKNKNFVISGEDFELLYLTRLLLLAGGQSVTILHQNEAEGQKQLEFVQGKLNSRVKSKVFVANHKSLYYRLSKSDGAIIDTSKLGILDKKIREEVSITRQTKKIQYLVDTSRHPIEAIEDSSLDIKIVDIKNTLFYNDEQKNLANETFDEKITHHIEEFMNYLEELCIIKTKKAVH